jgi:hypothetical protein
VGLCSVPRAWVQDLIETSKKSACCVEKAILAVRIIVSVADRIAREHSVSRSSRRYTGKYSGKCFGLVVEDDCTMTVWYFLL